VIRIAAIVAAAVTAVACSSEVVRLGDGRERLVDASADSPGGDASTGRDAGRVPGGFGTPQVIAALSNADTKDDDPSLTSDLREIYFDSKRDGGMGKEDIWGAERVDSTATWKAAVAVDALNSADRETGIALAADGLTVWFSSDRAESQGGLDVFMANRASRTSAWSAVTRVEELSTGDDDLVSAVSDSGTTCLLARRPQGKDDYDMYVAERGSTDATWGAAKAITELNTDASESDAFLAGEGRELLFTRAKNLELARRDGTEGPFTLVGELKELNSSDDDRDPWATPDLGYVVFSSDRSGSYQLYEATRR
jgi:Tol biopolymer transport system component